ncbi:MAG: MerR family transcriptional regulator, heat shock protein HspR [Candidatus Dependentiae bacterium]|nr:MerR family transcriptional regulator, heat shock protein HspR [Candidatus Dependentiae bacterium]
MKRRKGYYSISVVAKMFDVHQQTIRLYEKEGLLTPHRTEGGTRLFSEEDVDKLEEIIHLTHKLGVNIAGVEMILRLQRKIKKMQDDMNKAFEQAQNQFGEETEALKLEATKNATKLLSLKKPRTPTPLPKPKPKTEEAPTSTDEVVEEWKVEYDE